MERSRGVTLLELLVAMLVTAFAVSGALLMVQAQQRLFYTGSKTRQAQQSGRAALLFLEQSVPLAGFGLDPAEAFDFAWLGCPGSGCTRDRVDGLDDLVFYARHPAARVVDTTSPAGFFGSAWQVNGISQTTLSVQARAGDTFPKGQIIQLACKSQLRFAHVTLAATQTAAAAGNVDLALEPVAPGILARNVPADPFRRQDVTDRANPDFKKWNECFTAGARAFKVDRYRFYVRPVDMGNGRFDPYLVLDQGIDADGDGAVTLDDEILVAEGIENLQVAYHFINPALPPAGATGPGAITVAPVGAAPGNTAQAITPTNFPGNYDAAKAFPLLTASQFPIPSGRPLVPARTTNDQGNIRAIQITIVARSPEPDPSTFANLRYEPGSPLWVMNFRQLPPWMAGYDPRTDRNLRAVFTTTVELTNMASRGLVPN